MYRALVNRMLDDTGVVVRLAVDGEDQGRLVRVVDATSRWPSTPTTARETSLGPAVRDLLEAR